jgi:hypothetical protein
MNAVASVVFLLGLGLTSLSISSDASRTECDLRINGEDQTVTSGTPVDVVVDENRTFVIEYGFLRQQLNQNRVRSHRINVTCLDKTHRGTKNVISYLTFLQINNCSDEFIKPINMTLTSSATIGFKKFAIDFLTDAYHSHLFDTNQSLLANVDLEVVLTQNTCFTSVRFRLDSLKKKNETAPLVVNDSACQWFYDSFMQTIAWIQNKFELFEALNAIDKFICLLVGSVLAFIVVFSIFSCFRCCIVKCRNK